MNTKLKLSGNMVTVPLKSEPFSEEEAETQSFIVVAVTAGGYWGKGKSLEEAIAQCRKAGASGTQSVVGYLYTGAEDKLKEITVDGMGGVRYPQSCASYRIGRAKMSMVPLIEKEI